MPKRLNQFMLLLMALAVIMSSAIGTTTVYADDGGATGESTEPVVEVIPTGDEATPPAPVVDETTSADGLQPVEQTGDQPATAEPNPVSEIPDQPAVEGQPAAEESISVPEILDQLPAGTELVALNEAGTAEPLATEAATEIITTGDPMWCPDGVAPGGGGCTGSFGDFATLIDALEADALLATPVYAGAGVIWVEDSYNGNDDTQIAFDGLTLNQLTNLTIRGGWSGINNDSTITGTSVSDVSMVFVNWTGNIWIENMDIVAGDGAAATFGLGVNTSGNITLDNVSVNSSAGSADGAKLSNINAGDVSITNSEFNDNLGGNGLLVESSGTITLNTVEASRNMLDGAYLNNCLYASGLCQGNSLVTVTSATTGNLFNNNGFDGLVIDAGGGIAMDHVAANGNGLDGAALTSVDTAGIGNVVVTQSEFNLNANGVGLDITADGNINLTDVTASDNKAGAALDTTVGVGAITVNATIPPLPALPNTSNFTGNDGTGLHADSGSTITLANVVASNNGTNGAYLDAIGNVTVTDSVFNDNVHFNFPADPGLYAESDGGNITLTNVIADGNDFGAGAVLITKNNGAVNVTGGHFNENGTFGVQAKSQNGDITLDGITASLNKIKGVYLGSYGLGNIFIGNSAFVENGSYGIYASTSQGDVNLDFVTVTGDNSVDDGAVGADNLTDYGAELVTHNGGKVFVNDSSFTLNTAAGLRIISSGQVNLTNVTADQNGGNGVEVFSTYTYSCRCADSQVVSVEVNVDGNTFTNNGGYGLMVKPGPAGTLTFFNLNTFGGNGLNDYLLDRSDPSDCQSCGCDAPPPTTPKDPNIVDVPFTGGTPVRQDYENFSSTILRLPNGSQVQVNSPFVGSSNLEGLLEKDLPGKLGAGTKFIDGMNVSLTDEDGNVSPDGNGTITIKFKAPKDSHGKYSVLFWDPTLNNGAGGWVRLPIYEAGTSFPLHPDDPEDERTVLSGVRQVDDTITLTVNFAGVFVLTAR